MNGGGSPGGENRQGRRGNAEDAKKTLKAYPQGELQLARGVGVGCFHEVGRDLVIGREVVDSKLLSAVIEGGGVADEAVFGDFRTRGRRWMWSWGRGGLA